MADDFDDFDEKFRAWYGVNGINGCKLFIRGKNPEKRRIACNRVKEIFDNYFKEAKESGVIASYEVEVINLEYKTNWGYADAFDSRGRKIGNNNGDVFIPIFYNLDCGPESLKYLPLTFFDRDLPGIFSLTEKDYLAVGALNWPKVDCYDSLWAD